MNIKFMLKVALVPIIIAVFLFLLQTIFGWLSAPDNNAVIMGVVSLSLLILATYFIIKKIYFTNE